MLQQLHSFCRWLSLLFFLLFEEQPKDKSTSILHQNILQWFFFDTLAISQVQSKRASDFWLCLHLCIAACSCKPYTCKISKQLGTTAHFHILDLETFTHYFNWLTIKSSIQLVTNCSHQLHSGTGYRVSTCIEFRLSSTFFCSQLIALSKHGAIKLEGVCWESSLLSKIM